MNFSEQWLRSLVNPQASRDELVARLSMAGLEVEAVTPVAGEFSGVVVGEILSAEQHSDADKLRVCQVSDGEQTQSGVSVSEERSPYRCRELNHDNRRRINGICGQDFIYRINWALTRHSALNGTIVAYHGCCRLS